MAGGVLALVVGLMWIVVGLATSASVLSPLRCGLGCAFVFAGLAWIEEAKLQRGGRELRRC